jgi:hypothetical protein
MIPDRISLVCDVDEEAKPPAESSVDLPRIEAAVREILIAIGEDPDRSGLAETPQRVARAYAEVFSGFEPGPGTGPVPDFRHFAPGIGAGQGHSVLLDL